MNEDLPFDQFVRWQLAGDEIDPLASKAVVATGFLMPVRASTPRRAIRRKTKSGSFMTNWTT